VIRSFPIVPVVFLSLVSPVHVTAQDTVRTKEILRAVAGRVLHEATFLFVDGKTGESFDAPAKAPPGVQLKLQSGDNDWRYWNGVLLLAMMRMGEVLGDSAYPLFSRRDVAFCFENYRSFEDSYRGEPKYEYPFSQQFIMEELDDCGAMGSCVIEISRSDPRPAYLAYVEKASAFIQAKQARLEDHTLIRLHPQKWTLWADDLYMGVSFLSRVGQLPGHESALDDAALQVTKFHHYLFDNAKGLMHHCWYSSPPRPGIAFWGRANGWAILAQVDLLDRLPADHPMREELLALLRNHIAGIAKYEGANGLWHQLLDKPDSFLETSCSAMFTCAVARAVNRGYIGPEYASLARRGWEGVISTIDDNGNIRGVCAGTGVSETPGDYYSRPAPLNDPHGTGAVLLAGCEILQLARGSR
jgi:unsaturated rhamnogalacturonyl hydrolase